MPEIEITEDQYEYLEALREEIQTEVVGKYAHVRPVDALQYLIDSHEGDVAATVPEEAAGAGASGGGFVVTGGDAGATGDAPAELHDQADDEADEDEDADEAADDPGADPAAGTPMAAAGGGDEGMLSAMMQLLDTYDEKWAPIEGDTGYEVELPDGTRETANTRDDVRALLFKHYE